MRTLLQPASFEGPLYIFHFPPSLTRTVLIINLNRTREHHSFANPAAASLRTFVRPLGLLRRYQLPVLT